VSTNSSSSGNKNVPIVDDKWTMLLIAILGTSRGTDTSVSCTARQIYAHVTQQSIFLMAFDVNSWCRPNCTWIINKKITNFSKECHLYGQDMKKKHKMPHKVIQIRSCQDRWRASDKFANFIEQNDYHRWTRVNMARGNVYVARSLRKQFCWFTIRWQERKRFTNHRYISTLLSRYQMCTIHK
jgi:hypothetical protein